MNKWSALRYQCAFNAQIDSFEEKNAMYFFCSYFFFLLPLDHAVDKISVSHANEISKYIMNFICLKLVIWDSHYPAKFHTFTKKIKKVLCNMRQKIQKMLGKVSVSHKMFAHINSRFSVILVFLRADSVEIFLNSECRNRGSNLQQFQLSSNNRLGVGACQCNKSVTYIWKYIKFDDILIISL